MDLKIPKDFGLPSFTSLKSSGWKHLNQLLYCSVSGINLPLLPVPISFSFVYSVTPITSPPKCNQQITHVFSFWFLTMSSIQYVFHTSIAKTRMAESGAVWGQTCYLHPERLQWPLTCLCLQQNTVRKKGTNMVSQLSQMQQTTSCLIQDGSSSPGQEDIYPRYHFC